MEELDEKLTGNSGTVLVARAEVEDKYRGAVVEWLESLARGCEFIERDLKESGARQTAILQSKYFGLPEDVVTGSLLQRKGNLQFGLSMPDLDEIGKIMNQASQMKMLTKSVNPAALVFRPDEGGKAKGDKK